MTFKTTIIAAGALLAASAAAIPTAQAAPMNFSLYVATPQASVYFGPGYHRHPGPRWHRQALSPREVRFVLRNAGFHRIHRLNRHGHIYVVQAVSYNGFIYTVRLSAYSGSIISQHRVAWAGHPGPRWR